MQACPKEDFADTFQKNPVGKVGAQLPCLTRRHVYTLEECEGHCTAPRRGDIVGKWKSLSVLHVVLAWSRRHYLPFHGHWEVGF
eukprot:1128109-Pelagomonas_calceolata.AAC.1